MTKNQMVGRHKMLAIMQETPDLLKGLQAKGTNRKRTPRPKPVKEIPFLFHSRTPRQDAVAVGG